MGWASGSELAENLWEDIKEFIPKKQHKKVAKIFIKHFENMDCDTMYETTLYETAK